MSLRTRFPGSRPKQEWSNGTEFSGYSDFPEKRVHSKRIPKFSKTFPGIFTVPFSFGPEISEFLAEWKAPTVSIPAFTYLIAKLWNSLPDNLRTSESLNEFKRNFFSVTNF